MAIRLSSKEVGGWGGGENNSGNPLLKVVVTRMSGSTEGGTNA